jgi:hypothetical protein
MKIKNLLLGILFSYTLLFSDTITVTKGWNLVGGVTNEDVNLSKIDIAWTYSDGYWSNSLQENFTIDTDEGVWFLYSANIPYTFQKQDEESYKLVLQKGWNLVGNLNDNFDLYNDKVSYIFEYGSESWIINPASESIETGKGYWIYTNEALTLLAKDSDITPPSVGFSMESLDDDFFISDQQLNTLSPLQKREALDKILTSLFIGLPKDEMDNLVNNDKSISLILTWLNQSDIVEFIDVEGELEFYSYHWRSQVAAKSLGRLFLLPVSKEYVNMWVAYQLVNSKFFSGSLELNTVEDGTAINLMQTLYQQISAEEPIDTILYSYLKSEEHWRRFRSPEDNTREVLELQMGLFDDSLVPLAAKACQNYQYNEDEKSLVVNFNYNYTPLEILNETIYSCDQFYKLVSTQDIIKSQFINYFVDFYLPALDEKEKAQYVDQLIGMGADTYKSLLISIIFSDQFVLNSTKVKTIEELFLSTAKKLGFIPSLTTFRTIAETANDAGQPIMYYKLGRELTPPIDILSFATVSKKLREGVMMDIKHDTFNEWDAGWGEEFMDTIDFTTLSSMIDSVFIHLLHRN